METILIAAHVIGAGVLIGLVVISTLIVFIPDLSESMLKVLERVRWLGPAASAWQFITGAGLYWLERDELSDSTLFWTKLGLYALEGVIASMVIDGKIKRERAKGADVVAAVKKMRAIYVVHALLIVSIAVLGVYLAKAH